MFDRSAQWYDAFYARLDYAAEARRVAEVVLERNPSARTLLDVACGTGRHLEHLAERFECAGVDIEPGMLEIARERLPARVSLEEADMRTLDIGRTFDAVTCLFSSVGYMREVDALRAATLRMARHLAQNGVLVIEPWILPEAWLDPGLATVEVVEEGARKLVRAIVSSRGGSLTRLDMHYVTVELGRIETADERHELGLFAREDYVAAVEDAGLVAEFDDEGLRGRGLVIGTRR